MQRSQVEASGGTVLKQRITQRHQCSHTHLRAKTWFNAFPMKLKHTQTRRDTLFPSWTSTSFILSPLPHSHSASLINTWKKNRHDAKYMPTRSCSHLCGLPCHGTRQRQEVLSLWKSHPHTPASLPVLRPQQRGRREREGEQAGWEGGREASRVEIGRDMKESEWGRERMREIKPSQMRSVVQNLNCVPGVQSRMYRVRAMHANSTIFTVALYIIY